MKRYLWIGGLVLAINAYGGDNPFDLAKNMQKIEAEDTMLLDTLEDEAKAHKKDDIKSDDFVVSKPKVKKTEPKEEEIDVDTPTVEESNMPVETKPQAKEEVKTAVETKKEDTKPVIEKKLEDIANKQEVQKPVVEAKKVEPKKVETVKIDNEPVAQQPKKVEIKAEAKAEVKSKQEPKTVTTKSSAEVQTKVDEKTKHVVKTETKKATKAEPKTTKSIDNKQTQEVVSVVDINLTKEKEEMAKKVQQELEEAIKDVDRED